MDLTHLFYYMFPFCHMHGLPTTVCHLRERKKRPHQPCYLFNWQENKNPQHLIKYQLLYFNSTIKKIWIWLVAQGNLFSENFPWQQITGLLQMRGGIFFLYNTCSWQHFIGDYTSLKKIKSYRRLEREKSQCCILIQCSKKKIAHSAVTISLYKYSSSFGIVFWWKVINP